MFYSGCHFYMKIIWYKRRNIIVDVCASHDSTSRLFGHHFAVGWNSWVIIRTSDVGSVFMFDLSKGSGSQLFQQQQLVACNCRPVIVLRMRQPWLDLA
jgi:hypothetical protein